MPPDETVAEHERADDPHRVTGDVLNDVVKKRVLRAAYLGGHDDSSWRCDGLGEELQDGTTLDRAPFVKDDPFGVIAARESSSVAAFEQSNLLSQERSCVHGHDDEPKARPWSSRRSDLRQ